MTEQSPFDSVKDEPQPSSRPRATARRSTFLGLVGKALRMTGIVGLLWIVVAYVGFVLWLIDLNASGEPPLLLQIVLLPLAWHPAMLFFAAIAVFVLGKLLVRIDVAQRT